MREGAWTGFENAKIENSNVLMQMRRIVRHIRDNA